ncbi:MAG: hypothetical protein ACO21H_07130 [Sediminibacterium sp.]
MTIEKYKNNYIYNGLTIPISESNSDYLNIKEMIANGAKVIDKTLDEAKEAKLFELKINFDNASKKPFALNGVIQIDKDGKPIKKTNAFYNIQDVNSLTDSANIIFAGSIMKTQAFLKLLCVAIGKDFDAIKNQVNALSDNPTTASIANIPYTTKDIDGKEIRVLLSFQKIEEIFGHVFNRVADKAKVFNIIEQQILSAKTIEEVDKIDINFQ